MSRRIARLCGAVSLILGVAVAAASPAHAVLPDRVGWWNKLQQIPVLPVAGPVNLPLPPIVATDDLPVVGDSTPEGFIIAAVRYVVPPGATARLTLVDTNDRALLMPPGTSISACPTTRIWDGLINGRWDSRPTYDCGALSATSSLTSDGLGMTWDLPPAFQISPGAIDVVLVPSGSPIPFAAVFAAPSDGSLVLTDVPATVGDTNAPFDPAPTSSSSSDAFAFSAPLGGIDDFSAPLPGLGSTPRATRTLAPTSTNRFLRPTGSPLRIPDSRAERTLAFLLLVALGAALFWFGGRPARPPRLLGSLGHGQTAVAPAGPVAGVGRFARPRAGRDL